MMDKSVKATHIMHNVDVPSEEQGVFIYDDETIIYFVVRTNAKHKQDLAESKQQLARKIRIKVHPDLRVIVGAPIDAEQNQIHSAVLKRARWIWQNIQDFRAQMEQVPTKQYISGDAQFYLGKCYQLKIHDNNAQAGCVKLSKGKLNVYLNQISNSTQQKESVKALIEQWYQYRAKVIFHQRLSELLPKVSWVKGIPTFRIMAMKKQWGSCSTKGTLMLNPHLVKAPKACIDYVILHELCHIAEHNHSEKFWRLLTQVMPSWKAVKLELDGMAEFYLNE